MPADTGRFYTAIPGPSVMPDRVLAAMMRPAPDIYAPELRTMVEGIVTDLKAVARTDHDAAIYIGNGHAAWEAAVTNTQTRGDRVLVCCNGRFGHGWAEVARALGCEVEVLEFGKSAPVDPARVAERLAADAGHAITSVMVVHTDTSSGIRSDVAAIRAAIDAASHPALLQVDCIASMGCDTFEMDRWGVDVAITASQKGLMTPPGLAFVFFGPKAKARQTTAGLRTPYWDWARRADPDEFYQYFFGTAPTHHLFALREALTMLVHEEGITAAWARHARLARAVWAAHEAWGQDNGIVRMNMGDAAFRSHALTAAGMGAPNATRLREWLKANAGVTLGIGLGMAESNDPAWHGYYRVAHMGHVNAHMTLGVLAAMEAGLRALAIPHGSGALDAAAAALAEAG